jgi:hypothetical protein
MFQRPLVICSFFLAAAILWWGYQSAQLPAGLEAKGNAQDWAPWVSLAGAIVSLVTGVVTLGLKLIELRQKKP